MGQHRLQPVGKHHHLKNAAYVKKLLLWSLGIMVPFLVLFSVFPSGTSLYKPSYNRIVVSQLRIPASRIPKLSLQDDAPQEDSTKPVDNDDDENSIDDDDNDPTLKSVKKQSNTAAAAANPGVGKGDNLPKATKKHRNPTGSSSLPAEAKKQKQEMMSESLSADESARSSSNTKKQSDGAGEEEGSYGDDKKTQSDASPSKAKKQKELGEGDHETKKKNQNKKGELNAESKTKKNTKDGKIMQYTEEMPEVELDEALSISGKKDADQPNIAEKKSIKTAKADENMAETELYVEESTTNKEKADRNDEGPSTTKPSRKEKRFADEEEENLALLGKEVGLEEYPTSSKSTNSKRFNRKAIGMSYEKDEVDDTEKEVSFLEKKSGSKKKEVEEEDEEDGFTQSGKKGKPFAKLGKSSDGGRSSAEDHASDVVFLKEADEEAFLWEPTNAHKKKGKQSASELEELEDVDTTNQFNYSPELDEVNDGMEEPPFLEKPEGFNQNYQKEYSIIDQKHGEDMEFVESSRYKLRTTRSLPSPDMDYNNEFVADSTRKVVNEDSDYELKDKSLNEAFADDPFMSKALPLEKSKSPETCEYFKGRWTMDTNSPPYEESNCPWKSIDDEQRCKTTKKTSAWRWQPNECSMEHFKANAFLQLLQGKSMAFVGDNMVKAQMKSLVCLLAEVETPSLLYDDKVNQSMSWHFSSSNVTLSLIWSPYLVQQSSEDHYSKLQLDKLDTKWAEMLPTLDVLVLGVGTQFSQPSLYRLKDDVVGCYSCEGLSTHIDITNLKEISLYSGFRASMRSSIMGIGALPGFEGVVLFLQPFGFEGNGSYFGVSLKMKDIQDQELKKAHTRGSISNQSKMEVLHTNLNSVSNHDPIKSLQSPTCSIPSLLANTWNQILQHTLTRTFTLESQF